MKLLTKGIIKKLPKMYSQEHVSDPVCKLKFFTPTSSFTWYVLEAQEQEDGDWLFFGKVFSHMCPDGELGYFTLNELKSVKGPLGLGIERDMWFKEKPISQCKG